MHLEHCEQYCLLQDLQKSLNIMMLSVVGIQIEIELFFKLKSHDSLQQTEMCRAVTVIDIGW